jgi:catechol 2,3-dioxygenase-like lactoylglutathione lyase family enzyme
MTDFFGGNVTLMVSSVEKSVQFYEQLLGLRKTSKPSEETVEFDGGGMTIRLHARRPEISDSGSGTAAVGLRVEDVEATIETLRHRSVRVGRVLRSGDRRMALFDDPDGNHLYLFEEPGFHARVGATQ